MASHGGPDPFKDTHFFSLLICHSIPFAVISSWFASSPVMIDGLAAIRVKISPWFLPSFLPSLFLGSFLGSSAISFWDSGTTNRGIGHLIRGGEREPQPQTVAALSVGESADPFQVFVSPCLFPFDVLTLAHASVSLVFRPERAARPLSVSRYFCNGLLGLSGTVLSSNPS